MTKMRGYLWKLEKGKAERDGISAEEKYLIYHIGAEYRFVAPLWRLFHIVRLWRFSRKGKTAKGVHNYVYPKHLHNGHGRIEADKGGYH